MVNNNYQGLSYQTSSELRAYMHLRRPENPQGVALMKRPGIVKTDDFLDCIDKDQPKGSIINLYPEIFELESICYIRFSRDVGYFA
jgi:hypothetical protein